MTNKHIPIFVQLYSVHEPLAENFDKTIADAASCGYEGVEFFGSPEFAPSVYKEAARKNGLQCKSWHAPMEMLLGDAETLKRTVDFFTEAGVIYPVMPWMPPELYDTPSSLEKTAEKINSVVEILAAYGLYTGYHNHDGDFDIMQGTSTTKWSALREATDPRFVMQLDTGNAFHAGGDVNAELSAAAGRSQIIHLKPYSHKNGYAVMTGDADDCTDYAFISEFCKNGGGTEFYVMEYECAELYPPMDGIRVCYERALKILQ